MLSRVHEIGQVSSALPCWKSTGSVMRPKYGRDDAARQNAGFSFGRPYVRSIRSFVVLILAVA